MMFWICLAAIVVLFIVCASISEASASPKQRATSQYGPLNEQMVCPHCTMQGKVRTKKVTQKKGVSGGKATAAVLTGGISLLATGLSRMETGTEAHCDNCRNTWQF
jgi:hypothetical protein